MHFFYNSPITLCLKRIGRNEAKLTEKAAIPGSRRSKGSFNLTYSKLIRQDSFVALVPCRGYFHFCTSGIPPWEIAEKYKAPVVWRWDTQSDVDTETTRWTDTRSSVRVPEDSHAAAPLTSEPDFWPSAFVPCLTFFSCLRRTASTPTVSSCVYCLHRKGIPCSVWPAEYHGVHCFQVYSPNGLIVLRWSTKRLRR